MKLQDLLNKISSYEGVKAIEPIESHPPYYFYRVKQIVDDDVLKEYAICIYVDNYGTEQETAYIKDGNPITMTTQTTSKFDAFKQQVIETCRIIKVQFFVYDDKEKYAQVVGFVLNDNNNTVTRKEFIAFLDANNKLKIYQVV